MSEIVQGQGAGLGWSLQDTCDEWKRVQANWTKQVEEGLG